MKLRIRNVAMIEEADLELYGITVIAGKNNTGKSTVGKTVFSLFNSLVNIEDKIIKQKQELIYQMLVRKSEDMLMKEDGYFGTMSISSSVLRRYARELSRRYSEEEQRLVLREYLDKYNSRINTKEVEEDIINEIERINQLPIERLTRSAVSAYFGQIFYSEINNVYQLNKDAVIETEIGNKKLSIVFTDNICTGLQQQIKILSEAVYLDNPFVLDSLNNGIYGLDEIERNTVRKLQKNADVVDDIVQMKYIEEKIQEVFEKINEITSGSILQDESRSYYYKDQEMSQRLNVNNLSAGLKSFVIIKTLLENGSLKNKDVLILDEPEIHLHPDWQLRYAEIIILLQKAFELTIIITTHSSHFMEALRYFSQMYEQDDKCTYYLSEKSEFGCRIKNVTNDPTEIYSQLVDSSILLDRMKFKMEETKDE